MAHQSRVPVASSRSEANGQRRRLLQVGLAAAAATMVPTPVRGARFVPNETLVSAATDLFDLEYSQSLAMFARVDDSAHLWVGDIDRATGDLIQPDGRQILADTDTMDASDIKWVFTGPEWVMTPEGDQVVYTKFPSGKRHNASNARIGLAKRAPNGQWSGGLQGPDLPRYDVFGSSTDGGVGPAIYYLDNNTNKRWRDLYGTVEEIIPGTGSSLDGIRFVEGQRALAYRLTVAGVPQAFRYDLDTKVLKQLTFDSGKKQIIWMWRAPEFGDEYVLLTLVDRRELRVYRELPSGPGGAVQWTVVYSVSGPRGSDIQSLEPFTYAGHSYMFMDMQTIHDYPHEIWFSNIDGANPIFRCISKSTPLLRVDPEYFITDHGPIIYFNQYDPALPKAVGSLGFWRSDPGVS